MKILLIGYHNPGFTNGIMFRKFALEDLGHTVLTFDDRAYQIPNSIRARLQFIQNWDYNRLNHKLDKKIKEFQPDICLTIGGSVPSTSILEKLKQTKIKSILWTTDVSADYAYVKEQLPLYDHIFCAGTEAIEKFKSYGITNAIWIPFACHPKLHHPVKLSKDDRHQYARDIVFVGSHYPNREEMFEPLADLNIGIWGPGWEKIKPNSPLKEKIISQRINYPEWIKIFSATKISVVTHFNDNKIPCYQASPKLYESMACGAFTLVDQQSDALKLFKDKEHLVYYNEKIDLREKILYYLAHPEQRKTIAKQGYQETITNHTYPHRLQEILNITLKEKTNG